MSCPFSEEQLTQLQAFIQLCNAQPQILNHPKLSFFKDYLVSLGVTIPTATFGTKQFTPSGDGNDKAADGKEQSISDEESEPEYVVNLDMDGVIEGDPIDDNQIMGDSDKEPTDEERDQCDEKRTEAIKAFSEQQFDEAIKLYSEAIVLNPQSALLFAKRGQVFLKLNKPNACVKDCSRALELNCDSAAAYKFRGRAYRLLGKFEEACHDLCESLKIDYDDQTNEWLNEVKPNAEKLRHYKFNIQRRKEEKEHRERSRRVFEAHEAHSKAKARDNAFQPGGLSANDFANWFSDPEISSTFQDPEIMAAFTDMSLNPSNFSKYQNNPKIAAAIQKLQGKLGNAAPSSPFSGVPGFRESWAGSGAAPGAPGTGPKQPTDDDVGLD